MSEAFNQTQDESLISILSECWKQLLDIPISLTPLPKEQQEASDFLNLFYLSHCESLFKHLLESGNNESKILYLCEILCGMISQHSFRSRQFVIQSGLIKQFNVLIGSGKPYMELSAVRMIRASIGTPDISYQKELSKFLVWDNVIGLIRKGRGLVVSAVLELLEFCRKENLREAIESFCRHQDDLRAFAGTVGLGLITRYEQNVDDSFLRNSGLVKNGSNSVDLFHRKEYLGESVLEDKPQAAYFDNDEDEDLFEKELPNELNEETAPYFSGLVDYKDDDSDEEFIKKPIVAKVGKRPGITIHLNVADVMMNGDKSEKDDLFMVKVIFYLVKVNCFRDKSRLEFGMICIILFILWIIKIKNPCSN